MKVPEDEWVGLDCRSLDDAVKKHPVAIVLEDAGGD